MANKKSNQKKPKQPKMAGQKGGSMSSDNMGSPAPVRKPKKKK